MEKVAAQFPDDNEIAVLYAESVMDLSPWNYWQPGGHVPNQHSGPIVPTLERVLARDPSARELDLALTYLNSSTLEQYAQALLSSNEVIFWP